MSDSQIKRMVDRFLGWRLPEDFNPDGGITFKRDYTSAGYPMKNEPTGTNLFDATQAEAMIRYMLDDRESAPSPAAKLCTNCGHPLPCHCDDVGWAVAPQPEAPQTHYREAYFELIEDEDGRVFWHGAEDGWKDACDMGDMLILDAKQFKVGTVIRMEEPHHE